MGASAAQAVMEARSCQFRRAASSVKSARRPHQTDQGVVRARRLVSCSGLAIASALIYCIAAQHDSGTTRAERAEAEMRAAVIDACQRSVKSQLQEPGSAKFTDWKASIVVRYDEPRRDRDFTQDNGEKRYSAGGNVGATDGVGAYVGTQAYVCDATVTQEGEVRAKAYLIENTYQA